MTCVKFYASKIIYFCSMSPMPKKQLTFFLLSLVAGGILLASFHHHEDGKILDDCPICRFQDSGITASDNEITWGNLFTPTLHHDAIIEEYSILISHVRLIATLPNAPPFFS
jgi:hypothetical protein